MGQYTSSTRYGLRSGLFIWVVHLIIYYFNREWLVSVSLPYAVYAIQLVFMVMAALAYRQRKGGLASFREVLREAFIAFLWGMLVYFACYYLLFNLDPDLVPMQKAHARESILWIQEKGWMDEKQVEKALESWEATDYSVGLMSLLSWLPFRIFGGFLLSALVAVMVRR